MKASRIVIRILYRKRSLILFSKARLSKTLGTLSSGNAETQTVTVVPKTVRRLGRVLRCGGKSHTCWRWPYNSFQVPMPNSPLFFNYLCLSARFLQDSRSTIEAHTRVYSRILVKVCAVAMEMGVVKTRLAWPYHAITQGASLAAFEHRITFKSLSFNNF